MGTKVLLYEAGEALRFDELSIRAGVSGVQNVLAHLGMTSSKLPALNSKLNSKPYVANKSAWLRASASGIVASKKELGDSVVKGDLLADIGSPFGDIFDTVVASRSGIIIGKQNIPMVQEGDAMFHVAYFDGRDDETVSSIHAMSDALFPERKAARVI